MATQKIFKIVNDHLHLVNESSTGLVGESIARFAVPSYAAISIWSARLVAVLFSAMFAWVFWRLLLFASRRELEWHARRVVSEFDGGALDLVEEVEGARAETLPLADEDGHFPLRNGRLAGYRLRSIAYALADQTYFQYGKRDRSEANLLITRKFMRDKLEEYKDLRFKDRNEVIDMALYLSFMPTLTLRAMNEYDSTWAFEERKSDTPHSWWWWPVFARTPRRA